METLVREVCHDSIAPPLMPSIERLRLPTASGMEAAVLKVEVPRSLFVHRSPGGYLHRLGSSRRQMSPEYLARLFQQRSQAGLIRFDEQTVGDAVLDDLSEPLWRRFQTARTQGDGREDFLHKLGMARQDDAAVWRPSVAGILLGSEDPRQWLPNAYIQAVAYVGKSPVDKGPGGILFTNSTRPTSRGAFLVSDDGMGLDVSGDRRTEEAFLRVLPLLAEVDAQTLAGGASTPTISTSSPSKTQYATCCCGSTTLTCLRPRRTADAIRTLLMLCSRRWSNRRHIPFLWLTSAEATSATLFFCPLIYNPGMATPAQIEANRLHAKHSTGPRTPEGKSAVAQNRTTHGLTGAFAVLPCEDREAYRTLLEDYIEEYGPETPTEQFFVTELVQAQWRLMRADAIEAELLNPGDNPTYSAIAEKFRDSDALTRLGRYAQSARRAYYEAQEKLEALRRERSTRAARDEREDEREFERRLVAYLQAPVPTKDNPVPIPLPPQLDRELDDILTRNPSFDPKRDASQMSKQLRQWFERMRGVAA